MCAVALIGVVSISMGSDDDDGDAASTEQRTETQPDRAARRQEQRIRASYTVKTGDTLGAIAERTGVTVERLLELNPELDPQALVSGQRIKLRE